MYLKDAYNCFVFYRTFKMWQHTIFTDRSVTSGRLRVSPGRPQKDQNWETGLGSQQGQSLKSCPLKQKQKKRYYYLYIHTQYIATVPSGPHPESTTRSPLIGLKKVSTQLSSMGVRRQLSSGGSVSVNSNMWRVNIHFYTQWNMNKKCVE